ncbi:putative pre-16S rRNA nuclease [Gammaproteobacteria bacterium]
MPEVVIPSLVLGFDFGMRRIGVAVGQTVTRSASPLKTLHCIRGNPDWSEVSQIVFDWKPDALVVGLPIPADNTETSLLKAVRQFVQKLTDRYPLPVHTVNEFLSSWEAELTILDRRSKQETDPVAAQIILQTWLNGLFS